MRLRITLALTLFVLLGTALQNFGQATKEPEPTVPLETTVNWLREKLSYTRRTDSKGFYEMRWKDYSNCILQIEKTSRLTGENNSKTSLYTIDMAYVSTGSVIDEYKYAYFHLNQRGKLMSVETQYAVHYDGLFGIPRARWETARATTGWTKVSFGDPNADNKEMAERVKKAFDNLARICSSQKKINNEPF
jgi:hypothetical protein